MKSGIKSRMKMYLEQRRQAVLQLHLSDQQFYCHYGATYIRGFTVVILGLLQFMGTMTTISHFQQIFNLLAPERCGRILNV